MQLERNRLVHSACGEEYFLSRQLVAACYSHCSFRIERKSTEVIPELATRWQDFSTFLQMKGILLPLGLISLDGSNFGLTLSRDFTLS